MEERQKIEMLKDEYLHLQRVVEDFDSKSITIKAWSVTGSLAVIGIGLDKGTKPELFLVASLASVAFLIIECFWKSFQLAFYGRVEEIERWFRSPVEDIFPFQISSTWDKNWQGGLVSVLKIMIWPHVFLPHAIVAVVGLYLFLTR